MLREAIINSGIPIKRVAESVNRSRRWLYMQFEKRDVDLDTLLEIGKVIHFDFSREIPELHVARTGPKDVRDRSDFEYPDHSAEFWKNKYLNLLEEYSALLKKRNPST